MIQEEKINNRIESLRKAILKISEIRSKYNPITDMVYHDKCIDLLIDIHKEILVLQWVLN
jgi:hypothetical protein